MTRRRVVVTGIGVVSPIGLNAGEFWDSLAAGRGGIGPIESMDTSLLAFKNAAEAKGFHPADHFDERSLSQMDRFAHFAVVAAREACRDAGVEWTPEQRARTAVVTGSCVGGQDTMDTAFDALYAKNRNRVHPLTVPRIMANAGASAICMELGATGPTFTFTTACSSSSHAIGHAFWMIRSGIVDRAVTGGSEAPLSFGHLKAWEAIRTVAPDTCRPFSRDRKGMILGEGGAMLVLETLESAAQRGAPIYGEIVGFGMSSDAHHLTSPSVDGPAAAMKNAMADGGLAPEEVAYINAHGTATTTNDPTEVAAIRKVFGVHADHLAVSSTKSMHGHCLGAAGALEAVATVLALKNEVLPPTANYNEPDPECDLDFVPNQARAAVVDTALSNSFAFGGLNAVLAFRRWLQ